MSLSGWTSVNCCSWCCVCLLFTILQCHQMNSNELLLKTWRPITLQQISVALYSANVITVPHRIGLIWSCNIDRWWMGCYIWYSEEGNGRDRPPSPLLAVRNVTAHPSTASVPITVMVRCSAVSKWPLKGQSTTVVTYTRYARYNVRWDLILLLFTLWTNQKLLFSRLLRQM